MKYQDLPEDERERLKDGWREETVRTIRRRERRSGIGYAALAVAILPCIGTVLHIAQDTNTKDFPILDVLAAMFFAMTAVALYRLLRLLFQKP